ncbi:hypothetical protein F183_A02540 [Bryobacterales bacterium F-183]|nr:hypothetical protein F183_A02540 [Bryobacterales bacterium F-183]
MAKTWKIGGREIARTNELPDGVKPMKGYRIPSAGVLASDPQSRRDALDLYRTLGGRLSMSADINARDVQTVVLDHINKAFDRQELTAFMRAAEGGVRSSGGAGSSGQSSSSSYPSSSSSSGGSSGSSPEKSWVDIQLLDEEGEPVAGERYVLKLTDGSIREGTLGTDGRVRVNGIDPGNCVVTFPDLHTKEWWRKS